MNMQLTGNRTILECEVCQNQIEVYRDELEYKTETIERNKGLEKVHIFSGEFICDECANNIFFSLIGSEYPLGTYNYAENEIFGGEKITSDGFGLEIEMDSL